MNSLFFYIVVPVYNTEKYLKKCIESVICQSYTNWLLILVDDGSTDGAGRICDHYSNGSQQILTIHQENKGQIAARMSANEYILTDKKNNNSFVVYLDSDDTLATHALETIKHTIETDGSDMVIYAWQRVKDGCIVPTSSKRKLFTGILKDKRLLYKIVFSDKHYNSMCLKSLSVRLLRHEDYSAYYCIRHGEDLIQSLQYYKDCKQISFINDRLYNYTVNETSVTHTVNHTNFSMNPTVRSMVWDFIEKENVWTNEDFRQYAMTLQRFLEGDLYRISLFPLFFSAKRSMFDNIRENEYYQKILSYPPKSLSILMFKYRFDVIVVGFAKVRYLLSSLYHFFKN